jgi:hypothetical protein
MAKIPRKQKVHKAATVEQLAEVSRTQAALDPPTVGPVTLELDPEFVEIKRTTTVPEIIEAMRAQKKTKRSKGRPATFDRNKILDVAAKTRAEGDAYTRLASRFHLSPKQLTNLVERNRSYFDRKVREFRATTRKSAIKE